MNKILLFFIFSILLISCSKNTKVDSTKGMSNIQDFSKIKHTNWRNVASSPIIITGKLEAPVHEIEKKRKNKKNGYINIKLSNVVYLKGATKQKSIVLKYYTGKPRVAGYNVPLSSLKKLNGKEVIAYVKVIREMKDLIIDSNGKTKPVYKQQFYFSQSPYALTDTSKKKQILNEISHQKYLSNKDLSVDFTNVKLNKQVTKIIQKMLVKSLATKAYSELQKMGKKATPYIIMHMKDYRELPVQQISLVNTSPNAFEGIAHYGPKRVVDVLSIILGQIEKESFNPEISNGGSKLQELTEINAWKSWLYHKNK